MFWVYYPIHHYTYYHHEDDCFHYHCHHWSRIPNQAHCTLFGSLQSPIKGMEGSLNHHLTLNWGKKLWNFTINKSRKKRTPCHFWIETTISNQYHHQNCKSFLLDEEWWTTLKIKEKIWRDPNIYFFDGWKIIHEDKKNRVSFLSMCLKGIFLSWISLNELLH